VWLSTLCRYYVDTMSTISAIISAVVIIDIMSIDIDGMSIFIFFLGVFSFTHLVFLVCNCRRQSVPCCIVRWCLVM
jgi:hypothetical protein